MIHGIVCASVSNFMSVATVLSDQKAVSMETANGKKSEDALGRLLRARRLYPTLLNHGSFRGIERTNLMMNMEITRIDGKRSQVQK